MLAHRSHERFRSCRCPLSADAIASDHAACRTSAGPSTAAARRLVHAETFTSLRIIEGISEVIHRSDDPVHLFIFEAVAGESDQMLSHLEIEARPVAIGVGLEGPEVVLHRPVIECLAARRKHCVRFDRINAENIVTLHQLLVRRSGIRCIAPPEGKLVAHASQAIRERFQPRADDDAKRTAMRAVGIGLVEADDPSRQVWPGVRRAARLTQLAGVGAELYTAGQGGLRERAAIAQRFVSGSVRDMVPTALLVAAVLVLLDRALRFAGVCPAWSMPAPLTLRFKGE